jgi:predicted RNA methylase
MSGSCGAFGDADYHFNAAKVAKELEKYRRKGLGVTTLRLRYGLASAGLTQGTVLDVGGGLGVLSLALLGAGMGRATVVEASSAYLAAATKEAGRTGRSNAMHFVHGDYVAIAPNLERATVLGNPFRTFVHPPSDMQRIIEAAGFRLVSRADTIRWSADVFART